MISGNICCFDALYDSMFIFLWVRLRVSLIFAGNLIFRLKMTTNSLFCCRNIRDVVLIDVKVPRNFSNLASSIQFSFDQIVWFFKIFIDLCLDLVEFFAGWSQRMTLLYFLREYHVRNPKKLRWLASRRAVIRRPVNSSLDAYGFCCCSIPWDEC